ncbi:MAG: hypothetical protein H7X77_02520, partial [Anaerolineae bacterium]|nr:hypothetical protein [Anaerolineae bacterium]
SIGLSFQNPGGSSPYFLLTYAVNQVNLVERVYLTSTGQHFGRRRWWFTCPCCGRRCGRMYLAEPNYKPACRLCHNLRYISAQEAHQYESGSIWGLVRAPNLATRAEVIQQKMAKCRRWSKRYERLLDRYLKLYPALARLIRQTSTTD